MFAQSYEYAANITSFSLEVPFLLSTGLSVVLFEFSFTRFKDQRGKGRGLRVISALGSQEK